MNLKKFCDYYALINKTDFSISDLKGNSDIEKAERYLKKSCKVDFANLDLEWRFINTCRKIRINIVHEQRIFGRERFSRTSIATDLNPISLALTDAKNVSLNIDDILIYS